MALRDVATGRYYRIKYVEVLTGMVKIEIYRNQDERILSETDEFISPKYQEECFYQRIQNYQIPSSLVVEMIVENNVLIHEAEEQQVDISNQNLEVDRVKMKTLLLRIGYELLKQIEPYSLMEDC